MKSYIYITIVFAGLLTISCRDKNSDLICRKVPGSNSIDCYSSQDSNFRVYFDQEFLIKRVIILKEDNNGYEVIKFNQDQMPFFEAIESIDITPDERYRENHLQLSYHLTTGKLVFNEMFHGNIFESYSLEKVINGYKYSVYYYLPNIGARALIYYFTLSKEDKILSDYFYYKKNKDNSYSIVTDDPLFLENNLLRDSLFIEYCESSVKDIKFISPEKYNYFPDFGDKKTKKVYSIKETIPYKKEPGIVADMWGFFKEESEYPFAHSMLFFNGDLLQRIKKNRYLFEQYEQKYPSGKIADYPSLKKSLSQAGFIEKDGKFEAGPQLKKKVQEIIDHN